MYNFSSELTVRYPINVLDDRRIFEIGWRVKYLYYIIDSRESEYEGTIVDINNQERPRIMSVKFDGEDKVRFLFSFRLLIMPMTLEEAVYRRLVS